MLGITLNSSNFWVQFIASLGFVAGFAWAIIRWIHNLLVKSVSEQLTAELGEIKKQTIPNGGGSLRDAIDRIEKKLDALESEVVRHLGYHEGMEARQEN
jgi:hypothetical protein